MSRYNFEPLSKLKYLIKLLLSFLITISSIAIIELSVEIIGNSLIKLDYLIISIGGLSLFCGITNIIIVSLIEKSIRKAKVWYFYGSEETLSYLNNCMRINNIMFNIKAIDILNINKDFLINAAGLIVESKALIEEKSIDYIYKFKSENIKIITPLDCCEMLLYSYPPRLLKGSDIININNHINSNLLQMRVKRVGDILVSIFLLILTAPIVLIAALLIKIEDNGPILYSQIRTGLRARKFLVFKLRTMRTDAENNGPQWSVKNDQRVTKIGYILRKTRIDELPQLVAVIQGKLSLIGPRPERPEMNEKIEKKVKYYKLRELIKPGLSGWAQVNYPYGASISDAENKLSYDLFYIRHYSILLDLLIIIKTIRLITNAKGSVARKT